MNGKQWLLAVTCYGHECKKCPSFMLLCQTSALVLSNDSDRIWINMSLPNREDSVKNAAKKNSAVLNEIICCASCLNFPDSWFSYKLSLSHSLRWLIFMMCKMPVDVQTLIFATVCGVMDVQTYFHSSVQTISCKSNLSLIENRGFRAAIISTSKAFCPHVLI